MKKVLLIFTILLGLMMGMAFLPGCNGSDSNNEEVILDENAADDESEVPALPDAVKEINDKTFGLVKKYASQLDGEWGDEHVALIESGQGDGYKGFEDMRSVLEGYIEESGALYIYALYPTGSGEMPFMITVDGSSEPDDFGFKLTWEQPFTSAWEGTPATSGCAYFDKYTINDLAWSAYAPVHNSAGDIVCILGVDYPAPEINDYPEWNSESDEWNEVEILYS